MPRAAELTLTAPKPSVQTYCAQHPLLLDNLKSGLIASLGPLLSRLRSAGSFTDAVLHLIDLSL